MVVDVFKIASMTKVVGHNFFVSLRRRDRQSLVGTARELQVNMLPSSEFRSLEA